MEAEKKRCMVCGKTTELRGGICDPCHERIRREAMGDQAEVRTQADKELRKHGVTPDQEKDRK